MPVANQSRRATGLDSWGNQKNPGLSLVAQTAAGTLRSGSGTGTLLGKCLTTVPSRRAAPAISPGGAGALEEKAPAGPPRGVCPRAFGASLLQSIGILQLRSE